MPVSLAALLRQPALGLTLLTEVEDVQREISWCTPASWPDPTPYLDGGELLLSVGMRLGPGGEGGGAERACRGLCAAAGRGRRGRARVRGRRAAAEVPSALVTAADSVGLDAAGTVQHAAPAGAKRRAAWLATELDTCGRFQLGCRR
jgi:purine catabolism regulator